MIIPADSSQEALHASLFYRKRSMHQPGGTVSGVRAVEVMMHRLDKTAPMIILRAKRQQA
jgi:hypothetical protein